MPPRMPALCCPFAGLGSRPYRVFTSRLSPHSSFAASRRVSLPGPARRELSIASSDASSSIPLQEGPFPRRRQREHGRPLSHFTREIRQGMHEIWRSWIGSEPRCTRQERQDVSKSASAVRAGSARLSRGWCGPYLVAAAVRFRPRHALRARALGVASDPVASTCQTRTHSAAIGGARILSHV